MTSGRSPLLQMLGSLLLVVGLAFLLGAAVGFLPSASGEVRRVEGLTSFTLLLDPQGFELGELTVLPESVYRVELNATGLVDFALVSIDDFAAWLEDDSGAAFERLGVSDLGEDVTLDEGQYLAVYRNPGPVPVSLDFAMFRGFVVGYETPIFVYSGAVLAAAGGMLLVFALRGRRG